MRGLSFHATRLSPDNRNWLLDLSLSFAYREQPYLLLFSLLSIYGPARSGSFKPVFQNNRRYTRRKWPKRLASQTEGARRLEQLVGKWQCFRGFETCTLVFGRSECN
jgi:hypothetical protein